MNTPQALLIATLALSGSFAMADEQGNVADTFVATKSRAEVRAEVAQAHAAGVLQFATETGGPVALAQPAAQSTLTRDQVRAELRRAPHRFNPSVTEAG
jgi:hypothetical protein